MCLLPPSRAMTDTPGRTASHIAHASDTSALRHAPRAADRDLDIQRRRRQELRRRLKTYCHYGHRLRRHRDLYNVLLQPTVGFADRS